MFKKITREWSKCVWTDSTDRSRRPTRVFSPPQLATGGRDDCALFQTMTIMSPVWVSRGLSHDVSRAEDTDSSLTRQTADRSRVRSLPRPPPFFTFFSTEPGPQKRSAVRCFPIRDCRRSRRNKALLCEFDSETIPTQLDEFNKRRAGNGSEFTNRHEGEQRFVPRPCARRAKAKSDPSVFYISAVTWNLHPALNFPLKYTTFHVTHTNPAAISLSLNRAESLYLNSLAERGAAGVGIVVTGWPGQKEKPQSCVWV